jgi:hypothetical protein
MLIQFVLTLLLAIALVETWRRRGNGALTGRELLGWTALWCGGIVVTWWPALSSSVAAVFGVGRGADLVTYLLLVFLSYVAFRQALRIEGLERSITTLTRKVAIDEVEMRAEQDKNVSA